MSDSLNQSVVKALTVLEALFEDEFTGKSLDEISKVTGIPWSTAWRLLKTMEHKGWVEAAPIAGSKQCLWQVSGNKLVEVAHAYEREAVMKVQAIKDDYLRVSGKELPL